MSLRSRARRKRLNRSVTALRNCVGYDSSLLQSELDLISLKGLARKTSPGQNLARQRAGSETEVNDKMLTDGRV